MTALISNAKTSVKLVGANGQISLGKGYAGRQVLVEEQAPGVWLIRTALVVPDNERWLHEPATMAQLKDSLAWAARNAPQATDVAVLFEEMNDGKQPARPARKTRSQQPGISKKSA